MKIACTHKKDIPHSSEQDDIQTLINHGEYKTAAINLKKIIEEKKSKNPSLSYYELLLTLLPSHISDQQKAQLLYHIAEIQRQQPPQDKDAESILLQFIHNDEELLKLLEPPNQVIIFISLAEAQLWQIR